ncbi:hypothetical protein EW145_g3663 [Phellinidium pouzarii]|uniref:Uncharacterized protein n=1 Tax=Phellinidium pouzarii TaxID=167371 RepID=A0A4S4L6K9_9AGAM|nr:hypothetical protein EW145_g3663 [Phellinidium pouzarii]
MAFSSAGHHVLLAGRAANGERAYLAEARFGPRFLPAFCAITDGTKPEDLHIWTSLSKRGNDIAFRKRTPVLLYVIVLRYAPDAYANSEKNYEHVLDATGPFSWRPNPSKYLPAAKEPAGRTSMNEKELASEGEMDEDLQDS